MTPPFIKAPHEIGALLNCGVVKKEPEPKRARNESRVANIGLLWTLPRRYEFQMVQVAKFSVSLTTVAERGSAREAGC